MDRDLWITYRQTLRGGAGVPPPDEMTLAAYLHGALDEHAAAPVEAWLAATPDALEQVIAMRQALAEDDGPAPERVVRRAISLVAARLLPRGNWSGLVVGLWQPLAWSGGALALLMVCGMAFQLGQSAYASTLAVEHYVSQEAGLVLNEASGDLI
ncbi:MAG: hypothetical protein AAF495_09945 [Pseudomonadota bacterium]